MGIATPAEAGRQREARITSITIVAVAAVFIVLRFWARRIRGGLGFDDYLELLSLVLLVALLACTMTAIDFGMGIHLGEQSLYDLIRYSKIMLVYESLYPTIIFVVKSSLLLMYNRMFPCRQIRNASLILWTFTLLLTLTTIMLALFQCNPIRKAWNPLLPGTCLNLRATLIYTALPNVLTDFAITCMPIRLIWNMEIQKNQKYILTLVFLSGCIFIVGSVTRFGIIMQYEQADSSYTILVPVTWTIIECASGIITGCFPILIPLLEPLVKKTIRFFDKDVTEIVAHDRSSSTERVLSSSHFSLESSGKKKRLQKHGKGPFSRLGSGGRNTPGDGADSMAFEVRVTTTIEVVTSILTNDGPGRPREVACPDGEIEMQDTGGFAHEYGPKSMSGWL